MVWLINLFASLIAKLPLSLNHKVGSTLGWLAWVLGTRLKTITQVNLALCFPEWSEEKRNELAKRSLRETGKALTEAFWLWNRPTEQIAQKILQSHNEALLDNALEDERGVLIATPHMGAWELCNLPLNRKNNFTYMYRPPRKSALEPSLIKWRGNFNAKPANLQSSGIRKVLQALKQGDAVGVLPDQEPDLNGGLFTPFFGVPANTMTLMSKLSHKSACQVIFCYAERLDNGKGWHMHYLEPEPGINSDNLETATAALNATVERCVLQLPEQYMWNYKRFRTLPDGSRRRYSKLEN